MWSLEGKDPVRLVSKENKRLHKPGSEGRGSVGPFPETAKEACLPTEFRNADKERAPQGLTVSQESRFQSIARKVDTCHHIHNTSASCWN